MVIVKGLGGIDNRVNRIIQLLDAKVHLLGTLVDLQFGEYVFAIGNQRKERHKKNQ